jgi:hypothetical protein
MAFLCGIQGKGLIKWQVISIFCRTGFWQSKGFCMKAEAKVVQSEQLRNASSSST